MRNWIIILALSVLIIFSARGAWAQEEELPRPEDQPQDQMQSQSKNEEILRKLDEVIAGQKEVSENIASMKRELEILKIRVTQQQ